MVTLLAAIAALCWATATLAAAWPEILRGERIVTYPELAGTLAVLATPFVIVYLVRFERRVAIAGRAQHDALTRLFPDAVIFTTQAFPETVSTLDGIRRFSGSEAPRLKADHRALTVTVTHSDLSVWDGLDAPRRIAMIPAREIGATTFAGAAVLVSPTKTRMVPAVGVRLRSGARLVLPVLVVSPRAVKPTEDDVRAVVGRVEAQLLAAYRYSG